MTSKNPSETFVVYPEKVVLGSSSYDEFRKKWVERLGSDEKKYQVVIKGGKLDGEVLSESNFDQLGESEILQFVPEDCIGRERTSIQTMKSLREILRRDIPDKEKLKQVFEIALDLDRMMKLSEESSSGGEKEDTQSPLAEDSGADDKGERKGRRRSISLNQDDSPLHTGSKKRFRSIYPYAGSDGTQLSFQKEKITERSSGWAYGRILSTNECGWYPSSFVSELQMEELDEKKTSPFLDVTNLNLRVPQNISFRDEVAVTRQRTISLAAPSGQTKKDTKSPVLSIPIFIPKLGDVHMFNVESKTTYGDLLEQVKRTVSVEDPDKWGLFMSFIVSGKDHKLNESDGFWLSLTASVSSFDTNTRILFKLKKQSIILELPDGERVRYEYDEEINVKGIVLDFNAENTSRAGIDSFDSTRTDCFNLVTADGNVLDGDTRLFNVGLDNSDILIFKQIVDIIHVKFQKKDHPILVSFSVPVSEVITSICDEFQISNPQEIVLKYKPTDLKPLDETKSLKELNVKPQSELHLALSEPESTILLRELKNIWTDLDDTLNNAQYEHNALVACNFNKMVEANTDDKTDFESASALIFTYLSFASEKFLLLKLMERYYVPHSYSVAERKKIQILVLNFLRRWIENRWEDFADERMLNSLKNFVNTTVLRDHKLISTKIYNIIVKKESGSTLDHGIREFAESAPKSKINIFKVSLSFWDINEEEIARQLTIIDHEMYRAIQPTELLDQAWNKPKLRHKAKNVLQVCNRINEVSNWVVYMILQRRKSKDRARRFIKLIKVAKYLLQLNNFMSMLGIIGGLSSASIFRLTRTKSHVPKKLLDELEEMAQIGQITAAYANYRKALHNANPPVVPYIGVHLQDLTFIEDGNPTLLEYEVKGEGGDIEKIKLINVQKTHLVYKIILEVKLYQDQHYNLRQIKPIAGFLEELPTITGDEAYLLSLEREKRK